jgi:putative tryptophan/tyrosine transport system substrate-binding protein
MSGVGRREFVALLGGAAAWPLSARAQQSERVRRVGVLANLLENDPEAVARLTAFRRSLGELGWVEGRNLQIDVRSGVDNDRIRKNATELIALAPDVILANAPPSVMALQQATRTVPIVFVNMTDPVGMGIVQSLARPGGNATGFTVAEFSLSAKWLEVLKEIAPGVRRVAVLRELSNPSALPQFAAIQAVASSFDVELSPLGARDAGEIERDVGSFARPGNGGLIVTRTSEPITQRDAIIKAASRHRLPAVYPLRFFVTAGGLISYGPDTIDQYRRAATYIDRILKGEKPADLAVQQPTKFELAINLKTAKTLGLTVPDALLARADEVIE